MTCQLLEHVLDALLIELFLNVVMKVAMAGHWNVANTNATSRRRTVF